MAAHSRVLEYENTLEVDTQTHNGNRWQRLTRVRLACVVDFVRTVCVTRRNQLTHTR